MRWTIRNRLLAGFGIVLVLLLAIAIAGEWITMTLSGSIRRVSEESVQKSLYLSTAERALWELRMALPNYVVGDAAARAKAKADAPKWLEQINANMQKFGDTALSSSEQAALKDWETFYARYVATRPKFFALMDENKNDEAVKWRAEQTNPAAASSVAALGRLVELNQQAAEREQSGAASLAGVAQGLFVVFVVLAFAVGGGVAVVVSRSIVQPITTLGRTALKLSEGDVSQIIALSPSQAALLEKRKALVGQGAAQIARIFEDALARGTLTEAELFDNNYQPIPNTNPPKYHTAYDRFAEQHIVQILDAFLTGPEVIASIAVDTNGYAPCHNTRSSKPLTGDYQTDLAGNRAKRIFNDAGGLRAARNTEPSIHQVHERDNGDILLDIAVPIRVRGKLWGNLRVGYSLVQMDEFVRLTYAFQNLGHYLRDVAATSERLAVGDLNVEFTPRSPKDILGNATRTLKERLTALIAEMNTLTHAAVQGELATRGQADQFEGAFAQVVQGVNDTLDAVVGPLQVAAEYVDRISKGDIPEKITDTYKGDFNTIKNNLNQCIEEINGMVAEIRTVIHATREGDLSQRANPDRAQGVYRKILVSQNDILDAVVAPINDSSGVLAQVARGDLTVKLNGNFRGDYAMLKTGIEAMANGLKGMALQAQQASVSMSSAIAEILASSTEMASTTREQASAVNQITSTVQEIKASAEQVAQRAQGVAESASEATQVAQRGAAAANASLTGMDDIRQKVEAIAENILALSEKTQQIGDIIETVRDIAGQSNILALNAAIEAAQAGEAGKGFRVVADEVRSLSEQSRQAAAQVKVILGDIQKATNLAVMATEQGTKGVSEGSALVNRTAETINELAQVVEQSAQAAQQIVAGVEQQTIGLDQIAIGMGDINQAAQQSAAGAQQSQKAAQDLDELAAQLKQAVGQYRM